MSKLKEAIFETALDFHEIGIMDDDTFDDIIKLCHPEINVPVNMMDNIKQE